MVAHETTRQAHTKAAGQAKPISECQEQHPATSQAALCQEVQNPFKTHDYFYTLSERGTHVIVRLSNPATTNQPAPQLLLRQSNSLQQQRSIE